MDPCSKDYRDSITINSKITKCGDRVGDTGKKKQAQLTALPEPDQPDQELEQPNSDVAVTRVCHPSTRKIELVTLSIVACCEPGRINPYSSAQRVRQSTLPF